MKSRRDCYSTTSAHTATPHYEVIKAFSRLSALALLTTVHCAVNRMELPAKKPRRSWTREEETRLIQHYFGSHSDASLRSDKGVQSFECPCTIDHSSLCSEQNGTTGEETAAIMDT